MFIDKKTLGIVVLCLTAGLLMFADIGQPKAQADTVIKDRDYQIATGHTAAGGDALYILDNRVGLMAVFVYDPNVRGLRARSFTAVGNIFGNPR